MSISNRITFSHVAKILKSAIIEKPVQVPLGRWSINKKNEHLMVDYSNEDHCGTCAQYMNTKMNIKNLKINPKINPMINIKLNKKTKNEIRLFDERYFEYEYLYLVSNNPN